MKCFMPQRKREGIQSLSVRLRFKFVKSYSLSKSCNSDLKWGDADVEWIETEIPERISSVLPDIEDDTLRNWAYLADLFIKDLSGETVEAYQTFKDGWNYQKIIDIIRCNSHRTML